MESGAPDLPIFDHPVLSDEPVYAARSLAEAGPGELAFGDETVWRFEDDWARGEVLGSVTIEYRPTTRPGQTLFHATFRFTQHGLFVVTGFVPGDGTWVGVGQGLAHGGGRVGNVPIEGRNPKRWG